MLFVYSLARWGQFSEKPLSLLQSGHLINRAVKSQYPSASIQPADSAFVALQAVNTCLKIYRPQRLRKTMGQLIGTG